jgi:hypothetical protein
MKFHDFAGIKTRVANDLEQKCTKAAKEPHRSAEIFGIAPEHDPFFAVRRYNEKSINELRNRTRELIREQTATSFIEAHAKDNIVTLCTPGKHREKIIGDAIKTRLSLLMEYEWYHTERPFYNVYPIVEKLVHNTKLNISAAFLEFPHRTMLFRFPAGHEPYGIKTILFTVGQPAVLPPNLNNKNSDGIHVVYGTCASAFVQYTHDIGDGSDNEVYTLAPIAVNASEIEKDKPYEPTFELNEEKRFRVAEMRYQALQANIDQQLNMLFPYTSDIKKLLEWSMLVAGEQVTENRAALQSIEDTIKTQRERHDDDPDYGSDPTANALYMGYQNIEVHQFVFKLAALVSMLHRGSDLITPVVLSKHQEKYDAAATDAMAKKWLEDKAAKIQGRGFSVGKELQSRSESSPHWRNPHMALYWTGAGRTTPVLKLRAGSVVMPKHLTEVPTGYGCPTIDELSAEAIAGSKEYVYLLRDPSRGYVKIGKTTRSVEERQKESSTFVPGGLKLRGYIVTADCTELETRLHREWAHKRKENEFFELTDDDVQKILTDFGGIARVEV